MKREIKVGLFAVVMLLLGWGVIRYLQGSEIFGRTNVYYAYYNNVGGIQSASHVVIHGVKVGTVTAVILNEDPNKGVEVELTIENKYALPVDSKAKIFSDGLMGGKAVEIVYGSSSEMIPDGGTIKSEETTDLMAMASSEMEGIIAKVTTIMDNMAQTLESVNKLMTDNAGHITSIVENVDGVTGNVNDMLAKEKKHLEEAMLSLNRFSKSLGDNAEQVDSIIDNMATFSNKLAEADLIAQIEGTVEQLNKVLSTVNDGDGSVSKLLDDKELYDNLAEASANLSSLLADLQENPHRYINVSVFGSNPTKKVEKAKAKAEKREIKRADELAEKVHEAQLKEIEKRNK
ncbi:MAG: MCE family protein [Alistipes sp.]|nr:MCE family protein [Alistipes sp.]